MRWSGGRQDRLRACLVKRPALCRPRMPSAGNRFTQPTRAEARTNPRNLPRSDGAHVMRIAAPRWNALLLPPTLPNACTFEETPPVRLPFTRSCVPAWLSTNPAPVASFFEPEGVLPTSANTTRHGHLPRTASRPRSAWRGDCLLSPPSPFAFSCEAARADEPTRGTRLRRDTLPHGPGPAE